MATERLEMRQIREILRLRWQEGLTIRQAANSVGRSVGAIQQAVARAQKAGLNWGAVEELDEATLELRLYGPPTRTSGRSMIDARNRAPLLPLTMSFRQGKPASASNC